MTEYPYDPDLPFVIARVKSYDSREFPLGVLARFRDRDIAEGFADDYDENYVRLIDTTPAPKIPADAEFIHWSDGDSSWYARRTPFELWEDDCGEERDVMGMLEFIGDAEVVVLKRA